MKKTLIALAAVASLSGCAGLSVNFDAAISYRSDVPYGARNDDTRPVLIVPTPAKAASGT